jgi:hypothetical protein
MDNPETQTTLDIERKTNKKIKNKDGMYRIDYGTTGNWIMLTFSTGK